MSNQPWLTVLTSPLRTCYYEATISKLIDAGADVFTGVCTLFVDGPAHTGSPLEAHAPWGPEGGRYKRLVPANWRVLSCRSDGRSHGTKEAFLGVIYAAADADAEFLLYFEDDVLPCANAVTAMCQIPVPDDIAFLTFCDIKQLCGEDNTPKIRRIDGYDYETNTGHWGNQALKFPLRALKHLASAGIPPWHYKHASDVLAAILLTTGSAPWRKYGVVSPSLIQHIGAQSLVDPHAPPYGFGRQPANFVGEDFDALTLSWPEETT